MKKLPIKEHFFVECHTAADYIYEAEKDKRLPALTNVKIWLHCLCCSDCAARQRNNKRLNEILGTGFFPPAPDFEDLLMGQLPEEGFFEESADSPAGVSLRGWVIIGFFMLFSLASAFFGMNFMQIAAAEGLSFLLPVGLTVGMVVTIYGALFIGSHLKELSAWFGLH